MRFNPEEITSVLRKEIEEFRSDLDVAEVGTILEVGDGIARVYGLSNAKSGELIAFSNGSMNSASVSAIGLAVEAPTICAPS